MTDSASQGGNLTAREGRAPWTHRVILGVVCALVIGVYAWSAHSGALESFGSGAQDSYYNLLVQGFRAGQLNLKTEVPPGLAQLADPFDPVANDPYRWNYGHRLHDLSFYKGKLFLYFGITPALVLFWPYVALTGHYLLHKDAGVVFLSAGFLVGAGLLLAAWRRYFATVSFWIIVPCLMALGLANFIPAILGQCDVYEVAISCGYALTMLALAGIWQALHQPQRRGQWLAAASLAYGLALGARPSLLFGAVILLVPVAQAWREKRRVWPLLLAATVPIVLIGLGLMFYNAMRFNNPLEFGQHYQLAAERPATIEQFSLRYLWFNFQVGFLEPARWSGHFPFVHDIALPPLAKGIVATNSFGVLTNIPFVWLALAAPLAWRRSAEERSTLRWFLAAVVLLFGMCALILCLHNSMCPRYELEFAHPLVLLAVIGVLALERALAGQPVWRWAVRCGWGLLLIFSMAFNLLESFVMQAETHDYLGNALLQKGKTDEAIAQFQQALQINPDHLDVHNDLGSVLLQRGRVDEAIVHYQKALELKPDDAQTHYNLGNALLQKGKTDEAITQFQQALQINPDHVDALNNLGSVLLQGGKVDEAIVQYQKALELKPDDARTHYNLGIAFSQNGKMAEAISQYQKVLQLEPFNPEAQNNLAWLLATCPQASLRNGAQAVELARQANELTGGRNSIILHTLAAALAETGRFGDAVQSAQKAMALARAAGQQDLAEHLNDELKRYEAGLPLPQ